MLKIKNWKVYLAMTGKSPDKQIGGLEIGQDE
jgi:hypothetical protein